MAGPDGSIGHAELSLGDSVVMIADEYPDMGAVSPKTVGGTPVMIHV
jgi:PhnB protein